MYRIIDNKASGKTRKLMEIAKENKAAKQEKAAAAK